jgi:hypothetical protein
MITTMRIVLSLAALACLVLGCDAHHPFLDILGLTGNGVEFPEEGWALLLTPSLDAACRKKEFNDVYKFIEKDAQQYPRLKVVETTSNIERKPEILFFENKQKM